MMNEDVLIESKMGKRNPFKVPEGYFNQLTEQVMQMIPEENTQTAQIQEM